MPTINFRLKFCMSAHQPQQSSTEAQGQRDKMRSPLELTHPMPSTQLRHLPHLHGKETSSQPPSALPPPTHTTARRLHRTATGEFHPPGTLSTPVKHVKTHTSRTAGNNDRKRDFISLKPIESVSTHSHTAVSASPQDSGRLSSRDEVYGNLSRTLDTVLDRHFEQLDKSLQGMLVNEELT